MQESLTLKSLFSAKGLSALALATTSVVGVTGAADVVGAAAEDSGTSAEAAGIAVPALAELIILIHGFPLGSTLSVLIGMFVASVAVVSARRCCRCCRCCLRLHVLLRSYCRLILLDLRRFE